MDLSDGNKEWKQNVESLNQSNFRYIMWRLLCHTLNTLPLTKEQSEVSEDLAADFFPWKHIAAYHSMLFYDIPIYLNTVYLFKHKHSLPARSEVFIFSRKITMTTKTSKTLMIQTSDGGIFVVNVKIAEAFGVIKVLLDNENEEVIDTIHPVDVSSEIFQLVLKFAAVHKNHEVSLNYLEYPVSEWDTEFINDNVGNIMELTSAAKILSFHGLWALCCKKIYEMYPMYIDGEKVDPPYWKLLCH